MRKYLDVVRVLCLICYVFLWGMACINSRIVSFIFNSSILIEPEQFVKDIHREYIHIAVNE